MTGYRGRIARSLVSARESADVSQRELAERLGRDKRTVQKWESGEMKISMEDFLEIFDALHVAMEPYSKWIRHPELFPNGLADIIRINRITISAGASGFLLSFCSAAVSCIMPQKASFLKTFCHKLPDFT